MQIPGGWLGQRFGGTRVFGICLGIASVLTMLTPLAARTSVAALITLRVIEGLALVCQQKTLSTILAKAINSDGIAGTSAMNRYYWLSARGQDGWILAKFSLSMIFMDRDEVEVHKTRPISSHLDRTGLVNNGFIIWHFTSSCRFVFYFCVCRFLLQNVFLKLINIFVFFIHSRWCFRFSCFLVPSRQRNHRKSSYCDRKHFEKKAFVHPLRLPRNLIMGTKRAIPSWQYRSILPAHGACHIIRLHLNKQN